MLKSSRLYLIVLCGLIVWQLSATIGLAQEELPAPEPVADTTAGADPQPLPEPSAAEQPTATPAEVAAPTDSVTSDDKSAPSDKATEPTSAPTDTTAALDDQQRTATPSESPTEAAAPTVSSTSEDTSFSEIVRALADQADEAGKSGRLNDALQLTAQLRQTLLSIRQMSGYLQNELARFKAEQASAEFQDRSPEYKEGLLWNIAEVEKILALEDDYPGLLPAATDASPIATDGLPAAADGLSGTATQASTVKDYLKLELIKSQLELEELKISLGTDHPRVMPVLRRVEWLKSRLNEILTEEEEAEEKGSGPQTAEELDAEERAVEGRLADSRAALDALRRNLSSDHPQVQSMEEQIEYLYGKLAKLAIEEADRIGGVDPRYSPLTFKDDGVESLGMPVAVSRAGMERQRKAAEQAWQQAERAAVEAAADYRNEARQHQDDPGTLKSLRQTLDISVRKAFEAQARLQQLRLKLAELDVEQVKAKQTQRLALSSKIIERRVADLMSGEDLSWPQSQTAVKNGTATLDKAQSSTDTPRPARTALDGEWQLVSVTGPGIISHEQDLHAIVAGDRWTMIRDGQASKLYALVLDDDATPPTIELQPLADDGSDTSSEGYSGTYTLKDNELRIAWGRPNRTSTHFWKRVSPDQTVTDTSMAAAIAEAARYSEVWVSVSDRWYRSAVSNIKSDPITLMAFGSAKDESGEQVKAHMVIAHNCQVTGLREVASEKDEFQVGLRIPVTANQPTPQITQQTIRNMSAAGTVFWLDHVPSVDSQQVMRDLNRVTIVAAEGRIKRGERLTDRNTTLQRVDQQDVPEHAIFSMDQSENYFARTDLRGGQLLSSDNSVQLKSGEAIVNFWLDEAEQGRPPFDPRRWSDDREFPFSPVLITSARKELPEFNWVTPFVKKLNERLAAVPPDQWTEKSFNLLTAIDQLLTVWSEGDDWDLQTTGQLLSNFVTANAESDNPVLNRMAHSELMLKRLARINGKLPDIISGTVSRDQDVRQQLEQLSTMAGNGAGYNWISQEQVRLSGLLQQAPCQAIQTLVWDKAADTHQEMDHWIFAMSTTEIYSGYRSSPTEWKRPPIDPVLLLTILESLAGQDQRTDDCISLIFADHHPCRLFERHIDDVLSGTLAYRQSVHSSLVNIYRSTSSDKLKLNISRLAPSVRLAAQQANAAERPRLMYFRADFAEPCKQMDKLLEKVAQAMPITLQVVDIAASPEQAQNHKIDAVPAYILMVDGQEIDRRSGLQSEEQITAWLTSAQKPTTENNAGGTQPGYLTEPVKNEPVETKPAAAATYPKFDTPRELLDYYSQCIEKKDYHAYVDLLTDDEAKLLAGMLMQSASMLNSFAGLVSDSGDQAMMRAISRILKDAKREDPPAQATQAAHQLKRASFMTILGQNPGNTLSLETLPGLLRQSADTLKDYRSFAVEMMLAMGQLTDETTTTEETSAHDWNVLIDGDWAVANQVPKPGKDSDPKAPLLQIEMLRVDGGWRLSKTIGDEVLRSYGAGPQINPGSTAPAPNQPPVTE